MQFNRLVDMVGMMWSLEWNLEGDLYSIFQILRVSRFPCSVVSCEVHLRSLDTTWFNRLHTTPCSRLVQTILMFVIYTSKLLPKKSQIYIYNLTPATEVDPCLNLKMYWEIEWLGYQTVKESRCHTILTS